MRSCQAIPHSAAMAPTAVAKIRRKRWSTAWPALSRSEVALSRGMRASLGWPLLYLLLPCLTHCRKTTNAEIRTNSRPAPLHGSRGLPAGAPPGGGHGQGLCRRPAHRPSPARARPPPLLGRRRDAGEHGRGKLGGAAAARGLDAGGRRP